MVRTHSVCVQKLFTLSCIFFELRSKLPLTILRNIYFAFIHSHFMYALEIYANVHSTYLDELMKLNNKLLQILQNKRLRYPVIILYCDFNPPPPPTVTLLHKQQLLIFVYKVLKYPFTLPVIFRNYFDFNRTVHSHNTRANNYLHLYRANYFYGQQCLKFKAAQL